MRLTLKCYDKDDASVYDALMAVGVLTLFRGVVVYVRLADVDDASARRRAATRSWAAAA